MDSLRQLGYSILRKLRPNNKDDHIEDCGYRQKDSEPISEARLAHIMRDTASLDDPAPLFPRLRNILNSLGDFIGHYIPIR